MARIVVKRSYVQFTLDTVRIMLDKHFHTVGEKESLCDRRRIYRKKS